MVLGGNPGPTVCGKGKERGSVTTMRWGILMSLHHVREKGNVPGGPSWCVRAGDEKVDDTL